MSPNFLRMLSTPLDPIQASELAETRNKKAAFLPMSLLPITLKKGILLGKKTPGDLSVWKGKGHSEQRPRDSHLLSSKASSSKSSPSSVTKATTRPVASKCAFRESRCSMSSRSCHDPLTFFQMQVHVPGLPAQLHVCHCQLGQLHGETRSGPWQVNIFRSLFPLSITNQCVSITTIPSSGEIYETNAPTLSCLKS